jgi:hypothetical protein
MNAYEVFERFKKNLKKHNFRAGRPAEKEIGSFKHLSEKKKLRNLVNHWN